MTEPGKAVEKWGDEAMYASEAMPEKGIRVYFLQGTPDPLGSIAAFSAMYTGKVVRDKRDVTDEERRYHLKEMQKTKLKAPLEAVNLHFMVEGVTRSFTHQMVRQRTAVYAQESLRFAVKEDGAIMSETALPPSIAETAGLGEEENLVLGGERDKATWQRNVWDNALSVIDESYALLVDSGMPAEDARGLLPHNITTRLNYATNLRNLQDHAGNRLCTQAQFEWRIFWVRLIQSMREYCTNPMPHKGAHSLTFCDNWQWQAIADLFKPVCYLTGQCQFGADFDRKCSIRDRVNEFSENGVPSSKWDDDYDDGRVFIGAIHPAEWLLDSEAAR
jgi:flavin-dependent thymidylate synthase